MVLTTPYEGDRAWDATQPLVASGTVGWVFDRSTWSTRRPDTKRHAKRGNVLFFDGHCENVLPGDIQTWTTTWRFDEAGTCHQRLETESLAEGFPRVTERDCTFVAGDFEITVAFIGGGTLELEYSFADFSRDRLILEGFEYDRLA